MIGALAVQLHAGVELRAAVEFAVDATTRSVMRAGTMVAFATAAELATRGGL